MATEMEKAKGSAMAMGLEMVVLAVELLYQPSKSEQRNQEQSLLRHELCNEAPAFRWKKRIY
ncbi:hypothetical protein D3C86_2231580 [compost metagenome]